MSKATLIALCGALVMTGNAMAADDPFLWLEEVESERALDWARAQNQRAQARLEAHPAFESIHAHALEVVNSDDRIAMPALRGGMVYNFWRDAEHVRGLWRRTSLDSYRDESPQWEALLDLDELADAEDRNWVWAGSSCRYPDYDRCLVGLSIGGADAAVRREFDLEKASSPPTASSCRSPRATSAGGIATRSFSARPSPTSR
jgi:prolyl oligopeptidase